VLWSYRINHRIPDMTATDKAIWLRLPLHLKTAAARACEAIDAESMSAHTEAPDSPAGKAYVQYQFGNDTVRCARV
jgi:hypothetical protein